MSKKPTAAELSVSDVRGELTALNTDELRQELIRTLGLTAENLVRLAAIVRELEERGEDLSELRLGIVHWLRRIAHGQVLPELVARYQGMPLLLDRAAGLPIPDQRKIASGEGVEVMVIGPKGPDVRKVPPVSMSRTEILQVFARDHLRDAAEQRGYLAERAGKPRRKRRKETDEHDVVIDLDRGGIEVNGMFVPRAQLAEYLFRLERK